jgi:hypothetical protein
VPVVRLGRGTDLGPLPAEERHDVGALGRAGDGIALADHLRGLAPAARREALGVIGDRPEVESRAEPREVTGVRRRMQPLAIRDGESEGERVPREGGMDVQIPEQDLLVCGVSRLDRRRRHGRLCHLAARNRLAQVAAAHRAQEGSREDHEHHDHEQDRKPHRGLSLPVAVVPPDPGAMIQRRQRNSPGPPRARSLCARWGA